MPQIKLRNAPLYVGMVGDARVKLRNAPMYVAVQSPPVVEFRSVRAYALTQPANTTQLRNVRMYALVQMAPLTYLAKAGAVALLEAINKEHSKTLTAEQVYFENPQPLAGDDHFNSQITMKPHAVFPYSGQMVFRYNRFVIADFFAGKDTSTLPAGSQTTIHGRLAAINSTFGCSLSTTDVVNAPVAANTTGLTLTIATTSILFVPGSKMFIGQSLPADDLSVKAPVTDLGGFDAEG